MRTRISEIDLLRFLAAIAVMLMHYLLRGFAEDDFLSPMHFTTLGPFTKYNYLAVNLFFIISGFMILMSVHLNSRDGTHLATIISPKKFILSRFLRLYPAFWFACTLTFILVYFSFNNIFHLTIARYLINMTMLNGFFFIGNIDGVYWTLCLELKFYLFILFLLYMKHVKYIERYLLIWTVITLIDLWLKNPVLKYIFITDFSPFFTSGCLFYLVYKHGLNLNRAVMLAVNFGLGLYHESIKLAEKITHYMSIEFSQLTLSLILIAIYLVFIYIINIKNSQKSYDDFFAYLGRLSYPLYLIHAKIGLVMFNLLYSYVNWYLLVAMTCVLMILIAHLINQYIEKPMVIYLKKKIILWDKRREKHDAS